MFSRIIQCLQGNAMHFSITALWNADGFTFRLIINSVIFLMLPQFTL